LTVLLPPTFTLAGGQGSASLFQGGSTTVTVRATAVNGFNSTIALGVAGLPAGVSAGFSPSSLAAPGTGSSTLTLNAATTARTGTYNIRIIASGGGLSAALPLAITVAPPPNFVLSESVKSVSVQQGASTTVNLSIAVSGGFNSDVTLALSNLATGVTATLSPGTLVAPGSGTCVLALTIDPNAPIGGQIATITATGGGISKTLPLAVTVAPPPSFELKESAVAVNLAQGLAASIVLTVSGTNGFNSPVALSVGGLPAGVTATFSAATVPGA
jgi:uncharacterized membrane protein